MKNVLCAGAIAVGLAFPLYADVAIWTNTERSISGGTTGIAGMWGVPGNWIDESGAPLEVAPTNGTHDIRLPALEPDGDTYTIYTGRLSGGDANTRLEYPAVNPSIQSIGPTGGVWDTWRWMIQHPAVTSQYVQPNFKRVFTIADASGFDGYWSSAQAESVFELSATESCTPQMSSLGAQCRPYVRVPAAGTSASLMAVTGGGTISKIGDGELKVGSTQGSATRFTVEAGTLTIEGTSDGEIDALCRKAALRLDATRADTILTTPKVTDGVEYQVVTNWADANGNGVAGRYEAFTSSNEYYFPYSHGAFTSAVCSPTGLPLVDFGSHVADKGKYGPSNCWLRLNREIKDPTAVFYAVQTPGGAPGRTILGTIGGDGFAFLTEAGDQRLFCNYDAGKIGRNGDIMINGDHVTFYDTAKYTRTSLTNLNVISIAVQPGAIIGKIGADRSYPSRSGGSRLGEVLVFTNSLTRAERVRIAQYLVRKWVTGEKSATDANAVIVSGDGTAIGVPDGRKAGVGEVVTSDGTFTKTGGGTLVVGGVLPQGTKIRVDGGAVSFASGSSVDATAPAADPYIWLDANDASQGKFDEKTFDGDDRTYVTKWHDHRDGVDIAAIAVSNTLPRMPWHVQDIGNGRGPGVCLGYYGKSQSHFILPTWGADGEYGSGDKKENDTYAGFIVYRNNEQYNGVNLFGSSNMDMMRSGVRLLSNTYAAPSSPSAFWSVNGVPTDPFANIGGTINQTNDVIVVAFRSETPLTVNAIAKDRKGESQDASAGRITVGEFITYHRPLSVEEFRNTEAYLLDKWLGKGHPAVATPDCSLEFSNDTAAIIDSDADVDMGAVSGGNGSLVKRGSGAVNASTEPNAADSMVVEGGTLSLKIDDALDGRTLFHFDASNADSFSTYEGDDGKTYITSWSDSGANGLVACSTKYHPYFGLGGSSEYAFVSTNPTLAEVVMPDGVARRVVSFGGYRNTRWTDNVGQDSASLYFTRSEGGDPENQTKVREIYVVQKYNESVVAGPCAHFIGDLVGNAQKAEAGTRWFMRGSASIFDTTYTSLSVQDGYLALDRVPVKASDALPNGWHLMSVGATNSVYVDSMMQDRNCNAGGGWIAEMVAFDFELSAEQRSMLERHLMRKWGIGEEAQTVQGFEKLVVAKDASLSLTGGCRFTVSTLGGGGELTVAEQMAIAEGGRLSFEYRAVDDVDHLNINGSLDLSLLATVRVDVAEGATVEAGDWPILSATGGITGLDLANVKLDAAVPTKVRTSLYMKDGTLWLRVSKVGTIVIMR